MTPGSREEAQDFAADCAEQTARAVCVDCPNVVELSSAVRTPWGFACSEQCAINAQRAYDQLSMSSRRIER